MCSQGAQALPTHEVQVEGLPPSGQGPQVAKVFPQVSMEVNNKVWVGPEDPQQLFSQHPSESGEGWEVS